MKAISILLTICLASVGHAATKQEVVQLLNLNKETLLYTEADATELDEVKSHLEAALDILENGKGTIIDKNACLNFAKERYGSTYSQVTALEKANAVCKIIGSLEIAKYAYEKYVSIYGQATAMDKAAELATADLKEKLPIIEYAYEKYASVYGITTALEKAVAIAKSLPKDSLDCLTTAYTTYKSSYGQTTAMTKAAEICK